MIIPLEHEYYTPNFPFQGMLIPYGEYKNSRIAECEIGSECITLDKKPCKLIARSVILFPSPLADSISLLLYGLRASTIFDVMVKNWRSEIYKDRLLFIVVSYGTKPRKT